MISAELILTLMGIAVSMMMSFFFSGAETAMISADQYALRQARDDGDKRAGRALELLSHPHPLMSAVLIGTNIGNVLTVLFFQKLVNQIWPVWASQHAFAEIRWDEAVSILLLTPVIVIFAEIFPKVLFRAKANNWIRSLTPIIYRFMFLTRPVIFILDGLVKITLLPFGQSHRGPRMTRADVILMLNPPQWATQAIPTETEVAGNGSAASQPTEVANGELPSFIRDPDERLLIKNIIQLDHRCVSEIMQPLVELATIKLGPATIESFLEQARATGYSRFPVYRDRIVNLDGYIDAYDVIRSRDPERKLEDFLQKAHYVPETMPVDDLLQEFLEKRIKTAIAINEHGGCTGWLTLEDILEEIVGELEDELDDPSRFFSEKDGTYIVEGRVDLEDVNELLGIEINDPMVDTLGGIIMHQLARVPVPGDEVTIEGWVMRVESMDRLRVRQVRIVPAESQDQ